MKKIFFIITLLCSFSAAAQKATKLPDIKEAPEYSPAAFGLVAGAAYACNAGKKLQDYELIVSRILMNLAPNEKMEKAYLTEYVVAKKEAMTKQQKEPPMSCSSFLKEFNKQKIFNSMVMSDGSVKNPDGTWLLPRGQKNPPKVY